MKEKMYSIGEIDKCQDKAERFGSKFRVQVLILILTRLRGMTLRKFLTL